VGGDPERYDSELRPALMLRAIAEIQDAGIEVDVWKIEGVEQRSDCEALVAQARAGGRDGVACVVLGRGADEAKVDHWLAQAALDRRRRASLRRNAEHRTLKREVRRRQKRGSVRFALLVLTLIMTAVIVTVVMFRTLYLLLG